MASQTYLPLIESLIAERAHELMGASQSTAFESIVNNLMLDHFDLSVDEIDGGVTDGSGDGQIDAMYVVVNGSPLTGETDDEIPLKGPLDINIVLIQSKNTTGFEETPLRIIRTTVADLADLSRTYTTTLPQYNEVIKAKFALARQALLASAGRTASVKVLVVYATKGEVAAIHDNVHTAAQSLKNELETHCATRDVEVNFVGAEELIAQSRRPRTRSKELEVEQALSSDSGDSFACLVTLDSLVKFLSDDKNEIVRGLFDANVRDFMGKTEVNDAIRTALESMDDGDFWWLNNGITIVASGADQKGKRLALTEPLVVNGLQTSNVVFSFMRDPSVSEERKNSRKRNKVLIKIIVPPDETTRDEIIKATNSQTHIPKPYLRGMDLVHRNIEDHLKGAGLFYERRKNQYKNAGKGRATIVTLTEAAQSLMAAFLFRSADARGRPNSLLKSDDDYQSLFSAAYNLDSFKNVILCKRKVFDYLATSYADRGAVFRNNVVFHVLAYISACRFFNSPHAATGWRNLTVSRENVASDVEAVVALFESAGATDQAAKSRAFQDQVLFAANAVRQSAAAAGQANPPKVPAD